MLPWLQLFERWAVQQLLQTPAFHRAVETVVKNVHRVRHGLPPEEMGGTKIDQPGSPFSRHFLEEMKSQLGRAEKDTSRIASGDITASKSVSSTRATAQGSTRSEELKHEGADAAWKETQRMTAEPPRQGFVSSYLDALREQTGNKKPPP